MKSNRSVWHRASVVLGGLALLVLCAGLGAQELTAPKYKFDPDWPKTMPNKWKIGGVTGLAVDKDDNVWVLDRPNDLRDMELKAELNPPTAACCTRPPAMIHIDKSGNVIGSFDPPQGHGMAVDRQGFVYVGNAVKGLNTVRKYDPNTGKLLAEVPVRQRHRAEVAATMQTRRPTFQAAAAQVRSGHFRPVAVAARAVARGGANAAAQAAALAAFIAKYPPTTPMIVGQIEEVRIDDAAHELYCSDSYLGGRVMVFDLDTFKFKRGWGAYGHKLSESQHRSQRPRLYPRRADAQGVQGPPHAEHLERRAGLRRRSRREPHHRHQEGRHLREGNQRRREYAPAVPPEA